MTHYMIIQSQDPFTQVRALQHYDLATSLTQDGNTVRMLLVQDGVSAAHRGAVNPAFEAMLKGGVQVFADAYALSERNIDSTDLHSGIHIAAMDLVARALLAGDKVIWH